MKRISFILIITFLTLSAAAAWAQEAESRDRWKLCLSLEPIGLGWPAPSSGSFVATRAGISLGKAGHWFTVFGSLLDVLTLDFSWGAPHVSNDQFWDVGVMYGRRFRESNAGYLYAGVGVARADLQFTEAERVYIPPPHNIWTTRDDEKHVHSWSVPVELRAVGKTSRYFGWAVSVFGDFNRDRSFGGAVIGVHIGS